MVGGQQRQPRQRRCGERLLPDAAAQGERLLGGRAYVVPPAGDELGEGEPLQCVDDGHAGAGLAGDGQHHRVGPLCRLIVTEVQCSIAEVSQEVQIGEVPPGQQRCLKCSAGLAPVCAGGECHGEQ